MTVVKEWTIRKGRKTHTVKVINGKLTYGDKTYRRSRDLPIWSYEQSTDGLFIGICIGIFIMFMSNLMIQSNNNSTSMWIPIIMGISGAGLMIKCICEYIAGLRRRRAWWEIDNYISNYDECAHYNAKDLIRDANDYIRWLGESGENELVVELCERLDDVNNEAAGSVMHLARVVNRVSKKALACRRDRAIAVIKHNCEV